MPPIGVFVETGKVRVFAGGVRWPGWCRSGRDEDGALQALIAYAERYRAALGPAARGFEVPADHSALEVVERLEGDATTDFGAPAAELARDGRPIDRAEANRLRAVVEASWMAFDRAAKAATGAELRKGPRGGGRELDAIVRHVFEADGAYLRSLGGRYKPGDGSDLTAQIVGLREALLTTLESRARGEPPARVGRSGRVWTPRYFARRSAWHALDHAWEIEDRAARP
jgi:hypothetical protein